MLSHLFRPKEEDRVPDRPRLHGAGQGQLQPLQLRRLVSWRG